MELSLSNQTSSFLWAFVLGAIVFAVYMVFSVLMILSRSRKGGIFVCDVLFVVTSFFLNYFFSLALTNGIIRLFVLMTEAVSFFLLYFTIGKTVERLLSKIISFVFNTISKIRECSVIFAKKLFRKLAIKPKKMLK